MFFEADGSTNKLEYNKFRCVLHLYFVIAVSFVYVGLFDDL